MRSAEDYLGLNYRMALRRDADGGYIAEVDDLPGCVADGESPAEAFENLKDAMRAWVTSRLAAGLDVPEPREEAEFSGKFVVRIPRFLHARLAREAASEGVSLNQYVLSLLGWASDNRNIVSREPYRPEKAVVCFSRQMEGWPNFFERVWTSPVANNAVGIFKAFYLPAGIAVGATSQQVQPNPQDVGKPTAAHEIPNRDDRALVA